MAETTTQAEATAVTPLEGKTTVDDKMTFEPERLSYAAAVRVAAFIASAVEPHLRAQSVVIAGDAFLADLGNLTTAKRQLTILADEYRRIVKTLTAAAAPAAGPAPAVVAPAVVPVPAIAAGLQSALGLVALLRENVEFRGVATKIDPRAFEIALAAELRKYPVASVFVPDLVAFTAAVNQQGSLSALWEAVQEARHDAWRAAGPLLAELGKKDAALDAATRNNAANEVEKLSLEVFELRRKVEPLTQTLGAADRRLHDLQSQWDKQSETTGLSMLTRLLRAEVIQLKAPKYLHAAVVSSGGHHRVSRHLFRMLFLGDGLSSMGGIVARWALLEQDGSFVNGGIRAARQSATFPGPLTSDDGWR